jgi:hypothetical protein
VIRAILEHLGLWLVKARPPPKIQAPTIGYYEETADSHHEQPDNLNYADPDYTWDAYLLS